MAIYIVNAKNGNSAIVRAHGTAQARGLVHGAVSAGRVEEGRNLAPAVILFSMAPEPLDASDVGILTSAPVDYDVNLSAGFTDTLELDALNKRDDFGYQVNALS